jgi:hypothetical protein
MIERDASIDMIDLNLLWAYIQPMNLPGATWSVPAPQRHGGVRIPFEVSRRSY